MSLRYAPDAAWKEDIRRTAKLALASPVSRQWKGCSQRNEG